jgi:hypothetical protein
VGEHAGVEALHAPLGEHELRGADVGTTTAPSSINMPG